MGNVTRQTKGMKVAGFHYDLAVLPKNVLWLKIQKNHYVVNKTYIGFFEDIISREQADTLDKIYA